MWALVTAISAHTQYDARIMLSDLLVHILRHSDTNMFCVYVKITVWYPI